MICVISLHFKKHKHYLKWIIYTTFNLPNTWEQSAKQKGAVALDEGGEEGEDAIDGERDEERLSTAYPVSQSAPEESTDHHPKIYDETCVWRDETITATKGTSFLSLQLDYGLLSVVLTLLTAGLRKTGRQQLL